MKQLTLFKLATVCAAFFLTVGCTNSDADKTTDATKDSTHSIATKPDNQQLKAEIQEREPHGPTLTMPVMWRHWRHFIQMMR